MSLGASPLTDAFERRIACESGRTGAPVATWQVFADGAPPTGALVQTLVDVCGVKGFMFSDGVDESLVVHKQVLRVDSLRRLVDDKLLIGEEVAISLLPVVEAILAVVHVQFVQVVVGRVQVNIEQRLGHVAQRLVVQLVVGGVCVRVAVHQQGVKLQVVRVAPVKVVVASRKLTVVVAVLRVMHQRPVGRRLSVARPKFG